LPHGLAPKGLTDHHGSASEKKQGYCENYSDEDFPAARHAGFLTSPTPLVLI
jgi:hypothetical protein